MGLNAIKTIDDLLWAQANDPGLVAACFAQVSIGKDLERYLKWLHDAQAETTVVAKLKRRQTRPHGIHPSSACKKDVCLLKLYYECTGKLQASRPYDLKNQQTWDTGTLLHVLLQTHFREMYGKKFQDEVPLEDPERLIKSNADGIFDFDWVRIVLEIKSIKEGGNFGWAKVQKAPMEDNVRQATFYMKLKNIPFANIFYVNKNAGEFKEHPIMFNPALWDEMEQRTIKPVVAAVHGGKMVPGNAGYHCRQCSYQYGCPAKKEERSDAKIARIWRR